MLEDIDKMQELVSLFRKYAYEFGLSNDMETYDLMLNTQKLIFDEYKLKLSKIKELKDALNAANEHYEFAELGYVGLNDLKKQLLNAIKEK